MTGPSQAPSAASATPSSLWEALLLLAVSIACVVLTVFLTWPQAAHMSTHVAAHQDSYFSMWRLGWVAHAIRTDPRTLFDGNIFYPTRNTLAYSDAMLLEGIVGAPLLWSGVSSFLTYNLLLFAGIAGSGVGMFVLVRRLTGSVAGGFLAAVVFTMAPYRIEHFMHLELQWTMWMPLSLWAVHRTLESPTWRHGVLAGVFLWLQIVSCVYYGVFLAIVIVALGGLALVADTKRTVGAVPALLIGGAVAALLTAPYLWPYIKAIQVLGGRDPNEVARYSAHLTSYLASSPRNFLFGWTSERWGGAELNLFPGITACALGVAAVAARPRRVVGGYFLLAALVIALSLGVNGRLYSWLAQWVPGLTGLRAPARFGILSSAMIAVLAGFGMSAIERRMASRGRVVVAFAIAFLLMATEYANRPMLLMPQGDPAQTALYRVVRMAPPGVVAELPMPRPSTLPGWEADYVFWSTAHWKPLVNGYSGYYPGDYIRTLERMRNFPDEQSIVALRSLDVRYVIVHRAYYDPDSYTALMLQAALRPELRPYGRFPGPGGDADLFLLEPQ